MTWDQIDRWLSHTPLGLLGVIIPAFLSLAVAAGIGLRRLSPRRDPTRKMSGGEMLEGAMVSAILGLMALLIGFTFSIVLNRFEDRRALVLEEANAIGSAYLNAQLLEQPHRARISRLLFDYLDNRIAFAKSAPGRNAALLIRNDRLVTDLWAATVAAYPTMTEPGLSGRFLECMNGLIDLDTSRKMARSIHVPAEVFFVVFVFLVAAAAMLGYLSTGRGRVILLLMVALLSLVLLLILDVDRPTGGGVKEDQMPMELLKASLTSLPPSAFDGYRLEDSRLAGTTSR
jgi:hypothetical protein